MGGAFTAVSDDEDAPFYNPAGLALLKEGHAIVLNPLLEVSTGTLDIYSDYSDVDKDNDVAIADFLRKNVGEPIHSRFQLTPGYARKNLAIYGLVNADVNVRIRDRANPVADVVGVGDGGGQLSVAHAFLDGIVCVGATGRVIHRWSIVDSYTSRDLMDDNFDFDNEAKTGTGFQGDAGILVKLPWKYTPDVALAVRDIGSPKIGDAVPNEQDIRFGLSGRRKFSLGTLIVSGEMRRIGYSEEDDSKKLYVGAEFAFPKILAVRCGLYQGYLSGGATVDFWLLKLAYATYGAETGAYAGQNEERRHAFQLELGF
jgi:hypothetical protein